LGYSPQRTKVFRFCSQGYCPQTCLFCSTRNLLRWATGKDSVPYISLSAQDLVKEVVYLSQVLPEMETIFISDDDFFTQRQRAKDFFEAIIKRKNNGEIRDIKFILSGRIDEVDEDIFSIS